MNAQTSSNNHSNNELIDEFINWFITKFVKYTDVNKVEKDNPALAALCEFIAFNECIKRPFFKILNDSLFSDKLERLYIELSKNIKECDKRLDYAGAFVFLRIMPEDKQKSIIDGAKFAPSQQNNIMQAIKGNNYDAFIRALGNNDCDVMLKVLSKMQYIFMGTTKNLSIIINEYSGDDIIFDKSLWSNIGFLSNLIRLYTIKGLYRKEKKPDARQNLGMASLVGCAINSCKIDSYEMLKNKIETTLGLYFSMLNLFRVDSLTKVACDNYFSRWLTDFSTNVVDTTIDVEMEFLNNVCDRCAYYIMREVLRGARKDITEYSIEENSNNPCFDDYSWYKEMISSFGTSNCIEILGKGILLYTKKIIDVYNDEIKLILGDDEKCKLENILKYSKYTDIVTENNTKVNNRKSRDDNGGDEYDKYIEEWKKKKYEEATFSIIEKIDDDEYEKLRDELVDKGFIWEGTSVETIKHILGAITKPIDYTPVIWIAPRNFKNKNNGCFNHASIINFLGLLDVKNLKDDEKPSLLKKLNYCFICKNSKKKYKQFESKFLTERKKKNQTKKTNRVSSSKHDEILKDIINRTLGERHPVYYKKIEPQGTK